MRKTTYREALKEALREEMRRDPTVFLLGEDIGRYWGGAFKVTEGLIEEFEEDMFAENNYKQEFAEIGIEEEQSKETEKEMETITETIEQAKKEIYEEKKQEIIEERIGEQKQEVGIKEERDARQKAMTQLQGVFNSWLEERTGQR